MAPAAPALKAGFTAEFLERPDGYPGFQKAYHISFGKVISLDPALMYDAVKLGEVDIITAFSTDSRIPGYNLFILQDDKSFFPPYHAAPVVQKEVIESFPEVRVELAPLSHLIDEETMQGLNFQVDNEKRDVGDVVNEVWSQQGVAPSIIHCGEGPGALWCHLFLAGEAFPPQLCSRCIPVD